jgi:hypothetical protein
MRPISSRNSQTPDEFINGEVEAAVQQPTATDERHADGKRHRWLTGLFVGAASMLSAATLGLLCYDVELGLAMLGVVTIAATITVGVHSRLTFRHADVVVRVDDTEIHISVINPRTEKNKTADLLIDLADYTLRQLQPQSPSCRKK